MCKISPGISLVFILNKLRSVFYMYTFVLLLMINCVIVLFKGPCQPPPFSMPSKLLILHCEVRYSIGLLEVVFLKACLNILSSSLNHRLKELQSKSTEFYGNCQQPAKYTDSRQSRSFNKHDFDWFLSFLGCRGGSQSYGQICITQHIANACHVLLVNTFAVRSIPSIVYSYVVSSTTPLF